MKLAQTVQRCTNEVVRIRRTDRLRQNVFDATSFEHGADSAAGDDARTFPGGAKVNRRCAITTDDFVRKRTVDDGHFRHEAFRALCTLANRFGNFVCFAMGHTNIAFAIADDDDCAKAETTTTLDDFRNAVDIDNLLN